MQVLLTDIGKRFSQKWIFKGLNMQFDSGLHYAVTGKNGSGKSTLLLIIAGYISPTRGKAEWNNSSAAIEAELVHKQLSLASPYLELIEEFTLDETLKFHQKFKPFIKGFNPDKLTELSGLGESRHKPIRHFSSGMKQRVKLLLAIASDTPLVLLDEPCANLDNEAVKWYQQLKKELGHGRTMVICSNHNVHEYPDISQIYAI